MATSNTLQLEQPVPAGGIRSVNFFNGRLLAGKDLSREQAARRVADARLGLALGKGVAFGLEVSFNKTQSAPGLPVAHIAAGLAVNGNGETLYLTSDIDIALARRFDATAAGIIFDTCQPLVGGTYVAGAGVYMLTIARVETTEGRAVSNGLDPANVVCNTDATVEAVRFRLLTIKPALYADLPVGDPSFQNQLAYRCFGSGVQPAWFANLLGAGSRQDGLIAAMRKDVLSDAEVPIGLLYFTGAADLRFIDLWSVRRPLAPVGTGFPPQALVDAARLATGQAMFLQFQGQIASLAPPAGDLGAITARSNFRYLPPAGIIPVREEIDNTDSQATAFFKDMTYRGPAFINAARIEPLLRESLHYPPIDTRGSEMVWLYRVRENRMAIDLPGGAARPPSYLVFASGHIPYRADAQFDLASFAYANYALAR
jgi:hypothetical protein